MTACAIVTEASNASKSEQKTSASTTTQQLRLPPQPSPLRRLASDALPSDSSIPPTAASFTRRAATSTSVTAIATEVTPARQSARARRARPVVASAS